MAYLIGGVIVATFLVWLGSLLMACADDEHVPVLVMPDVSRAEALRLLLAKAQREVDAINGVRR